MPFSNFFNIFNQYLSVIIPFLLSASRRLFPAHLCLRHLSTKLTATFCYCHTSYISHCFPLPFTPYSLP